MAAATPQQPEARKRAVSAGTARATYVARRPERTTAETVQGSGAAAATAASAVAERKRISSAEYMGEALGYSGGGEEKRFIEEKVGRRVRAEMVSTGRPRGQQEVRQQGLLHGLS